MEGWRKCSVCKKEIPFSSAYYECSVSSCKSKRKGFVFCKIQCWDEHRADLNHRNAWATEERSPREGSPEAKAPTAPARREKKRTIVESASDTIARYASDPKTAPSSSSTIQTETLVVVSKVKKLVKDLTDYNTSQCAIDALTDIVVKECRLAITEAKAAGRKTVMGRDFANKN